MPEPAAVSAATSAGMEFKDWLGVLGFVISVILLASRGIAYWRSRRDRRLDRQVRIDDAWFKLIVLDGAIPALNGFFAAQRGGLKKAEKPEKGKVRPYAEALLSYLRESEDLKARLKPVEELSTHAYETLVREVERLDDVVSPFCPHGDDPSYPREKVAAEWLGVQRAFDQCSRNSFALLRKLHFALHEGRDPNSDIPRP